MKFGSKTTMSGEGVSSSQLSATTTVSSVAVQAGDSRIVVSILKCGNWVQLQLAESIPNLLEIGSSQDETKKLLQDHELLLGKLKALEDQVWDLLCEADKTAEENKDQSQVYEAMAQTLGEAWAALIRMLEKRRALLSLTSEFFDIALEFAVTIDQAEDFLRDTPDFQHAETLKEFLQQHQQHTKVLLEKSLALLNKSRTLTEFIEEFKSDWPVANPEIIQGAHCSCLKIDSLLELLQDRRRQLDKRLKHQRQELEQFLHIYQWHQKEDQATYWFKKHIEDYLQKGPLGSSLSKNEELLDEHKQFTLKAKEWSSIVESLDEEALKILSTEGYKEKDHLTLSNQKLNTLHEEFWHLVDERQALLQEANDFFNSANKAFDKLESIDAYLKLLKSEDLSEPVMAMKHKDLQKEVKDCTEDALQKGQTLIKKRDSRSSQVTGIQETVQCIEKRADQLTRICLPAKEYDAMKQEQIISLENHLKKVSVWIQKISPEVARSTDPGSCLAESEGVLRLHLELAKQAKEISQELEAAVAIIKEVEESEPSGVAAFANTELLKEELKALSSSITAKLEVLKAYEAFLKSAKELEDHIQKLKEFYRSELVEKDSEAQRKVVLELAEASRQSVLHRILSVQNMGRDCLNLVNTNLDSQVKQVETIEHTISKLNKDKTELTDLWSTCQLYMNQAKSTKPPWRDFKEQLEKTLISLKILEEDLKPISAANLGSAGDTLSELLKKSNRIKTTLQELNVEVEYTIKMAELLSLRGAPPKEKTGKVGELTHLHLQIQEGVQEQEDLLSKAVKFQQLRQELERLTKSGDQLLQEPDVVPDKAKQANIHLSHAQERETQIRHLYKLALTLGMDIISAAKHSKCFRASWKDLQQQLDTLEHDSLSWSSKEDKREETPSSNLNDSAVMEDLNELRESFKDIKKKFNNLKFNYTKKAEKTRNLKVLKNQIQQVEMYAEKIQVLKKKVDILDKKVSTSVTNQPSDKIAIAQEPVDELQKQVNEFNKVVEEYKQNLDLAEHLQQIMEECQFWFEETSGTVVRVEKYSAECKTKETIEVLYKQFNKFVQPTVPQEEERIQQITNLAKQVYGPDEGIKYIEKTIAKHKEVLHSVNELFRYLKELEEKLEMEISNSNNLSKEDTNLQREQRRSLEQEPCKEVITKKHDDTCEAEQKKVPKISIMCPGGEEISQASELPVSTKDGSVMPEGDFQPEFLAEETLSGDEYECISPDDISLPPLAETPESTLLQSETEQEEHCCYSSHSLHVSSYSLQMQINTGSKRATDESETLTPAACADTSNHQREKTSSYFESFYSPTPGSYPKLRTDSPFAHCPAAVPESSTASKSPSGTLKVKPAYCMMSEVHETHLQTHSVHKSMIETQKQLHDDINCTKTKDRLPASPDAFSGLMFQSDSTRCCQRQMGTQEEVKSTAEKNSMGSLSGQMPNFSKLLSNVTVKEASPVTLEVEVTGFPEPALTWYKEGQKLTSDEHLTLLQMEKRHTLFIQKVCEKDAGHYVAWATNSSGTISSSATLHVKAGRGRRKEDQRC
ncbi:coiled-coil domain-containing protein 141 isoform X2 [Rhinatrema bivittatum]|uniref:coiled-coil domain-containing protein 141 isoform X2 n=1 Tax=Rhinatrema bivittatum TaxID=194408 RepID=UPI00112A8559|nr:coiled-coil domain-containing protein 141 isoform X2 [Rhinatrema bivittatum]